MLQRVALLALMTTTTALALPANNALGPFGLPPKADVVDDFHGTKVPDPWRILETPDAPETRAFIDAQNIRTRAALDTPLRAELRARLEQLINYPRRSAPGVLGSRGYLVSQNSGLQAQSVTYLYKTLDDANPRVLFDPNTLSADGTRALAGTTYTDDGALVAYGISDGGSDNRTVRIRNVDTGEDLPDVLTDMRFSSISWTHDNAGFFFSKYPDPTKRLNQTVYYHRLGDSPADAPVVYARPDNPELSVSGGVTEDGKYLVVYESLGTDRRPGLLMGKVPPIDAEPGFVAKTFTRILQPRVCSFSFVGNDEGTIYALTDRDAPRRKLVAVTLDRPHEWKVLIPELPGRAVIESVGMVGDTFVVTTTEDVRTRIYLYDKAGTQLREIPLPTVGTASVSLDRKHKNEFFISFTSHTFPTTVFRYDTATGQQTVWNRPAVQFDPDAYETKLVLYPSKDGTKVPMFVTHKKGLALDGTNPTLLYAYGGFSVGMRPGFSATRVAFLERGGVYAEAGIRGGDEYGASWHDAAKLEKRQNAFDDFHAAAEYLAREKYTSPKHLAIQGGSNGGLLTAVAMLQRPELYGAVVSAVPVADMLRFHRFGTGRFWTVEYGNADNSAAEFQTLFAYSPVHNVKPNVTYPPLLITTGDGDDRVVPAHSLKLAAAMLASSPQSLTLLRYQLGTGHGAGKPLAKALDESADVFTFILSATSPSR